MQAQIIQIGNSLGVRLPKSVLTSLHLERTSAVQIRTRAGSIVLSPVKKMREGWAAAFAASPDGEAESLWGDVPLDEAWGGDGDRDDSWAAGSGSKSAPAR